MVIQGKLRSFALLSVIFLIGVAVQTMVEKANRGNAAVPPQVSDGLHAPGQQQLLLPKAKPGAKRQEASSSESLIQKEPSSAVVLSTATSALPLPCSAEEDCSAELSCPPRAAACRLGRLTASGRRCVCSLMVEETLVKVKSTEPNPDPDPDLIPVDRKQPIHNGEPDAIAEQPKTEQQQKLHQSATVLRRSCTAEEDCGTELSCPLETTACRVGRLHKPPGATVNRKRCVCSPMAKLKREIAEAEDRAAAAEAAEAATAEKRFRAVLSRDKRKAAEVQAAAALAATQTHSDAETLGWGVPFSVDETTLVLYISCHAERHLWPAVHARMQADGHYNYLIIVGKRQGYTITPNPKSHVVEVEARDSYEALPEKVIAAFTVALAHSPKVGHVIKADIDLEIGQHARHIAIGKGSLDLPAKMHGHPIHYLGCFIDGTRNFSWHFGRVTAGSYWDQREANSYHGSTVYASGGAGYILSRRAMSKLVQLPVEEAQREYIYEDLMIGHQLDINGFGGDTKWNCCCEWNSVADAVHHRSHTREHARNEYGAICPEESGSIAYGMDALVAHDHSQRETMTLAKALSQCQPAEKRASQTALDGTRASDSI